jgi:amidophosphoribosyltransferase
MGLEHDDKEHMTVMDGHDDAPREACGVFGVFGHARAAEATFFGLFALQHRGQESAGICVAGEHGLVGHTGMGLASDVLTPAVVNRLDGSSAIGHVRYSTTGSSQLKNAQPLVVDYARGQLAVAHNGNLVNAYSLRKELEASGSIFQTTTDSEIIIHLMARPSLGPLDDLLVQVFRRVRGAFSIVMLTPDALIGVRDPNGFRPLSLGQLDGAYILASETSAFDLTGATFVRDVAPGEIVIITKNGIQSLRYGADAKPSLCIFEYVYFARPDSRIDTRTCHLVRKELGRQLAREYPVEADIVVAVPDSGNSAALGYSEQSGIPLDIGYIRNHYVGRTFISPSQVDRDMKVRVKLNVVPDVVRGKRVVIVDDSIVRGTTTFSRVSELKKAGAKEVHVRISCPPLRFPCFYGIDFHSHEQLIAARHTIAEIQQFLCADSLGYLSLDGMVAACGGGTGFCCACFMGGYPVAIEEQVNKTMMERARQIIEKDLPASVRTAETVAPVAPAADAAPVPPKPPRAKRAAKAKPAGTTPVPAAAPREAAAAAEAPAPTPAPKRPTSLTNRTCPIGQTADELFTLQ